MRARTPFAIGSTIYALAIAFPAIATAAECGDSAGAGGTRVPCACGDSVVTDTILEVSDPIVSGGPCEMSGLTVDAPGIQLDCATVALQGPGNQVENSTGVLVNQSGVTVERCTVTGFEVGIDAADGVAGLLIQANRLFSNEKGIRGGEPLSDSKIIGNTSSDNTEFGIQLKNGPVNNVIYGNTTQNNGRTGIQLNNGAQNNRILLNYVSGDGSRGGIRVDSSSSDNLVRDNSVDGGVFGIGFNSDTQRNFVHRNVITGTSLAGIWVNGPGSDNSFRQNLITSNQGEGIRLENQVDHHQLKLNLVFDNVGVGIEVCGAGNLVARNRSYNNGDLDLCVVANQDNELRGNEAASINLECPVPPECQNLEPSSDSGDVD